VVEASRATQLRRWPAAKGRAPSIRPTSSTGSAFCSTTSPRARAFPLAAPPIKDDLPLAAVQAYSIDDSQTTEIDDALSVQGLGTGTVTLGIHIAAPGLAISPAAPIDQLGRTACPPSTCRATRSPCCRRRGADLHACEGRDCPAVSLYVALDEATLEIQASETKLERVPIAANLRHDQLDGHVTQEWLEDPTFEHQNTTFGAIGRERTLSFLYRLAKDLKAKREVVRGKPENFNRPDYNFRLVGLDGAEPTGNEPVEIGARQRGSPLDLIVAEAMILANSTWGQWLAEHGVPGIYRSQASMAPGVKVRMGTKALPHAGIGVPAYAWSTSPLRRYTDLVNQWQIIAWRATARRPRWQRPFKPKDAELFSIISGFDAAYSAYNSYQQGMERFWTLKYIQQNHITELTGGLFREGLIRAEELPLVLPVLGAGDAPRGARLRVKLGQIDEITLDVAGTVLERLDTEPDVSDIDFGAEDDDSAAGPISIAVDVADADPVVQETAGS
jgi:exoribonuclease-2